MVQLSAMPKKKQILRFKFDSTKVEKNVWQIGNKNLNRNIGLFLRIADN